MVVCMSMQLRIEIRIQLTYVTCTMFDNIVLGKMHIFLMSVSTQKLEDDHCNDRFWVLFWEAARRGSRQWADSPRTTSWRRQVWALFETLWVGCISKWTLVWTIHAINEGFNRNIICKWWIFIGFPLPCLIAGGYIIYYKTYWKPAKNKHRSHPYLVPWSQQNYHKQNLTDIEWYFGANSTELKTLVD